MGTTIIPRNILTELLKCEYHRLKAEGLLDHNWLFGYGNEHHISSGNGYTTYTWNYYVYGSGFYDQ